MTDLERMGGEEQLKKIIDDFVERVFADAMIGFFFRNAKKERIKRHEFEHAARVLGSDIPYTGRPLRSAHAVHRIMGGQFDRRKMILRETLEEHEVPDDIRSRWLEHTESLRSEITGLGPGECK